MKIMKIVMALALVLISNKVKAQAYDVVQNRNVGIIIRANNDNSAHNEPIVFQVGQNSGDILNVYRLKIDKALSTFSTAVNINGNLTLNGNRIFRAWAAEFSGNAYVNDRLYAGKLGVGIGTPETKLHVKDGDIRVDGGEYQSHGPIVLHPDVDNTSDDVISFRNSTNEEMAKLQDGILTLRKGGKLQSDGELSLSGNAISFRNGFNTEMARLEGGTLTLDQIRLNVTTFPDYVFAKDYNLMPLAKVAAFIKKNKHLPNMPTEVQVVKEGMNIGQINTLLVEKVEELTLYTIAQEQQIKELLNRLTIVEKNMINNNKK